MISGSLFALVSFVLVATFTPGPSNISSASMGILYGYRNTLKFLAGLATGVFVMMVVSGLISTAILDLMPTVEPILRILGAAYILYLAVAILKASYTFEQADTAPMGYFQGLLLQILNPKLIVYAMTLFSAFLAPIADNPLLLVLAALILTTTAFCATSVWALFGVIIQRYLHHPRVKLAVNVVLSLLLVYTAIDIAGII
ncbi:MAG: LysE family translocator [Anaerolineae bacterium]|nr:LysE family translocator [Anaerolineae bacterium]